MSTTPTTRVGACSPLAARERIEDPDEIARIKRTWEPQPWAGGARPLYVKLAWDELTGRRLGQGWTYANETPVRRHL